jgi:hypothetical protein
MPSASILVYQTPTTLPFRHLGYSWLLEAKEGVTPRPFLYLCSSSLLHHHPSWPTMLKLCKVMITIGLSWLKGFTGVKKRYAKCDNTCLSNTYYTADHLSRVKLD